MIIHLYWPSWTHYTCSKLCSEANPWRLQDCSPCTAPWRLLDSRYSHRFVGIRCPIVSLHCRKHSDEECSMIAKFWLYQLYHSLCFQLPPALPLLLGVGCDSGNWKHRDHMDGLWWFVLPQKSLEMIHRDGGALCMSGTAAFSPQVWRRKTGACSKG